MNIAIFTDTYEPQINGVATSVLSFKNELEKLGHRVYVFCPSMAGRERKTPGVYRFFSIPYLSHEMREQRIAFPFSRSLFLFHRLKIDIVHFQVTHFVGAYGLLLAMLYRIPAVHTFHTLFVKYTHYVKLNRNLAVRGVKFLSRQFGNRCIRIISPSPDMRDEVRTYGVTPPIDIIPTGIEFVPDRRVRDPAGIRRMYRLPAGGKRLIFVGRFAREKNIELLLEILRDLNARTGGYSLHLVGDGPDRNNLEKMIIELGIGGEVTITGYIPREHVFDLLQMSDLLVFPSETETQGLVILESMSVGTPIVAADRMGAGAVMRDGRGGIAVEPRKEEYIAAIERILNDPDLYAAKSRSGLEKAAEWSASAMTRRLVGFYETAIRDYREKRFGLNR